MTNREEVTTTPEQLALDVAATAKAAPTSKPSTFSTMQNQEDAPPCSTCGSIIEFLEDVRSGLREERDAREIYRRMFLTSRVNGHEVPRNVALMFFSDDPEEWFKGARIEVVQFAADSSGNVIEERQFKGPLHHQLRDAIGYLRGFSTQHLEKLADRPEVKGWVSYPLPALEEAVVNAVYHRSYDSPLEPSKVYLFLGHRIPRTSPAGPCREN